MGAQGRVIVIGSANMDHVIDVERLPRPGETVLGRALTLTGGGKGANQAVAAARDGAPVVFVGCIGPDAPGLALLRELEAEGIDSDAVLRREGANTGAAFITVDAAGQNTIVVASGANARLDPAATIAAIGPLDIGPGDVCLLGFELPMDAVLAAAGHLSERGASLIINPAPAMALPADLLRTRPILTPNELEASAITGESDSRRAAAALVRLTDTWGVVTLGADGALLADSSGVRHVSGWSVSVVDTTGAGDTFSGVLAAALARGEDAYPAVVRANAAAALSVHAMGARAGMPRRGDIDAFLASNLASGVPRNGHPVAAAGTSAGPDRDGANRPGRTMR